MTNSFFPQIGQLRTPILVTGHTGFVGTWLISVLDELEIPWVGFSQNPKEDSMFQKLDFFSRREQLFGDLRDQELLGEFIKKNNPSAIIHLAADAVVLEAIKSPYSVLHNNFNSTLSLVSEFEKATNTKRMLVSTTDKVYKNSNLKLTFKESDPLEGNEPYSESKVATEALIRGFNSILPLGRKILVARAGNIIGGGDFAEHRLIPDIVRARVSGSTILIRMPDATRPWQHVLDVVFGYLSYLEKSLSSDNVPLVFNFGSFNSSKSVSYVVDRMLQCGFIEKVSIENALPVKDNNSQLEKGILDLDPSLAKEILRWENIYTVDNAVDITLKWWERYLDNAEDPTLVTKLQIHDYLALVSHRSMRQT